MEKAGEMAKKVLECATDDEVKTYLMEEKCINGQ
jgi:hypothetical protein